MTGRQYHTPTASSHRPRFVRLLIASILMTLALVLSNGSATLFTTAHAASAARASTASPAQSFPIRVFFSKFPVSVNTNFSAVFPVDRVSPTIAVATFAIQLLIAGPIFSSLFSFVGSIVLPQVGFGFPFALRSLQCECALAVLEMLDRHVSHLQAEHNQRKSNTACSSVRTGVYR